MQLSRDYGRYTCYVFKLPGLGQKLLCTSLGLSVDALAQTSREPRCQPVLLWKQASSGHQLRPPPGRLKAKLTTEKNTGCWGRKSQLGCRCPTPNPYRLPYCFQTVSRSLEPMPEEQGHPFTLSPIMEYFHEYQLRMDPVLHDKN